MQHIHEVRSHGVGSAEKLVDTKTKHKEGTRQGCTGQEFKRLKLAHVLQIAFVGLVMLFADWLSLVQSENSRFGIFESNPRHISRVRSITMRDAGGNCRCVNGGRSDHQGGVFLVRGEGIFVAVQFETNTVKDRWTICKQHKRRSANRIFENGRIPCRNPNFRRLNIKQPQRLVQFPGFVAAGAGNYG